ncbi:hypothetical protein KUV59_03330 [Marinobacter daepoensis]|uniref:hypothetical protein n=1 Tax=Marinobacter daepoensis TaxID=262077 RepID=UPI001C94EA4D|nr:hypothetical protein [Marinobacter daepoensis]MBY6032186.1 hypothetical protein [Marinobacter daepoensis]
MAAKKTKVVFIKRVEDRDKAGEKVVIEAGSKSEMTASELKKYQDCVRVIKDYGDEQLRPVLASGAGPDATGGADEGEGEGDEGSGD